MRNFFFANAEFFHIPDFARKRPRFSPDGRAFKWFGKWFGNSFTIPDAHVDSRHNFTHGKTLPKELKIFG